MIYMNLRYFYLTKIVYRYRINSNYINITNNI